MLNRKIGLANTQPASGQSESGSRESGKTEENSGMEIAGDARPQPAGWFRFADDKKIADWTLPFEENERDNFAVHRGQERQKRQAEKEEEEEWNTDR